MLNNYYIEKLLGFKDIIITNIEDSDCEIHIFFHLSVKKCSAYYFLYYRKIEF